MPQSAKAFLLAILLLWLLAHQVAAQKPCDRWHSNTSSAPSPITEVVAGVTDKRVYLCGYVLILPGNASVDYAFKLFTGTGVNCAMNQTVLLDAINLLPNTVLVNRISYAAGEFAPIGHSVCLQTTGNGTLTSIFYWAQF